MVEKCTFLSEFKHAGICFQRNQTQPVRQYLILDDWSVVEQKYFVKSHGWYFRYQYPTEGVWDGGVDTNDVKLNVELI